MYAYEQFKDPTAIHDCFLHFQVVLLGKFNGQGLGDDQELLVRVSEGKRVVSV